MKICKKCKQKKDLSDFYKHTEMADGHLNHCKECVKRRVSIYGKTKKGKQTDKRRNQKPERKRKQVIYMQRKRKKYPLKYKANTIVGHKLKSGDIKPLPCLICGNKKTDAHHYDYKKPEHVIWLCRQHHSNLHNGLISEGDVIDAFVDNYYKKFYTN